eukprot:3219601-Rhodomonas_salina.3
MVREVDPVEARLDPLAALSEAASTVHTSDTLPTRLETDSETRPVRARRAATMQATADSDSHVLDSQAEPENPAPGEAAAEVKDAPDTVMLAEPVDGRLDRVSSFAAVWASNVNACERVAA